MLQREYDYYYERSMKFQERVSRHILGKNIPLQAEVFRSVEPVPFHLRNEGEYRPIAEGETWGGAWESGWFRLRADIPSDWSKRQLALHLNLGGEALLFDRDGTPIFAFSAGSLLGPDFRKEIYQLPNCPADHRVEFSVEAAGNVVHGLLPDSDPELEENCPYGNFMAIAGRMRIGCFNREVWQLSLDLEILLDLLKVLPARSRRGDLILAAINRAADRFLEKTENVASARAELAPELARNACSSSMTVTGLGHAHIDTGYMWPVRETVRKCGRTFANQINLLEKYPDYVFGASSPLHYLFVKRHYPALYEKVKSCVRSGRWELLGGMWIESDCNIPCGESLVRQFLHGKNFFRDEFGIEVKNLWLPDTFGYPASLPQIAKLAGCPDFVSQKMSWNQMNSFPYHAFLWRGLDGSELLTHFLPENSYIASVRPSELIPAETRFNESTVTDEFLSLFGIGDGGGGPKEEYLERALRLRNLEGVPKFHFGRADAFFERLNRHSHSLPLWDGELYFENHRGTLTSQARIKRDNRKLEEMIAASETLWSALPVETYPAEEFERIWKILLLNQFHDILPGTSIQDVYERAACEYADAYTSLACLQKEAATRILTPEKEAITFFNSLNTAYCGFVELPESWDGAGLMQSGTAPVSVQQEGNRQYAAEVAIPPLGFVTFYRRGKAETVREEHPEYPVLENDLVRYLFDGCGRLLSALDKRLKREFIPADCPANAFSLYVDRPTVYEAWNLDKSYRNCQCSEAQIAAPCRVLRGSVRDVIEFHLKIGDSIIEQRVLLGKNSRRLDFVTAVDWREARKVLRVAFPVTVHARESVSDIPFGFVRRPTHTNTSWDAARFEVAIHKYADLSEADFGAALLNDCKYGCCLQGNTIDLSLLRAPKFPDWEADRGEQCFTYSFLPHPNDATTSTVHVEALQLNRPPCCFDGFSGTPELPVAIDSESVELTALKKAEKDSCLVMRLVERGGRHAKAVIRTTLRIQETSMLEWEDGQVMDSSDGTVSITFKPFEIKTFKLLEKEIS